MDSFETKLNFVSLESKVELCEVTLNFDSEVGLFEMKLSFDVSDWKHLM